jgi:hypothetical protein
VTAPSLTYDQRSDCTREANQRRSATYIASCSTQPIEARPLVCPAPGAATLKKGLRMTLAPDPFYLAEIADEGEEIVPHHTEDDAFVVCWTCHLWIVAPVGRPLCTCSVPGPVSPGEADKLVALEALRDALASAYRRRLFKLLLPMLDGATRDEAEAAWTGLWPVARERAARRLRERGLR